MFVTRAIFSPGRLEFRIPHQDTESLKPSPFRLAWGDQMYIMNTIAKYRQICSRGNFYFLLSGFPEETASSGYGRPEVEACLQTAEA